jgi:hypothetical protein
VVVREIACVDMNPSVCGWINAGCGAVKEDARGKPRR